MISKEERIWWRIINLLLLHPNKAKGSILLNLYSGIDKFYINRMLKVIIQESKPPMALKNRE